MYLGYVWKWIVRLYKPCTSATSESELCAFTNHVPRLRLKMNCASLQTMYLGYVWKWIRSREHNSASESGRVSLYSVNAIKVSRLTINRILIHWAFHGSLRCCETDRKTDYTTLLSLETQDTERGQLRCTRNYAWNLCVFQLRLSVRIWIFFCLRLTESTRVDLLSVIVNR